MSQAANATSSPFGVVIVVTASNFNLYHVSAIALCVEACFMLLMSFIACCTCIQVTKRKKYSTLEKSISATSLYVSSSFEDEIEGAQNADDENSPNTNKQFASLLSRVPSMTSTQSLYASPIHQIVSSSTNTYTVLLLMFLVIHGIARAVHIVLFITFLSPNLFFKFSFIEDNHEIAQSVFWFIYVIGLAPFFSTFASYIYTLAEVVRQSMNNVNGFIDMRIKYKFQFIATNSIIYSILLAIASLYLVPSESKVIVTLLRSVSLTVISLVSFVFVVVMLYYGFKIRHVLKRQWLIQQEQAKIIHEQENLIASIDEDYYEPNRSRRSSNNIQINYGNNYGNSGYYSSGASPDSNSAAAPYYSSFSKNSFAPSNFLVNKKKNSTTLNSSGNNDQEGSIYSIYPRVGSQVNFAYHSSSEEESLLAQFQAKQLQKAAQTENISVQERNHVLKWMLLLTIFLGISSTLQFILSIVFVTVNSFDVSVRLIGWILCELVPAYVILFFFWKRSNRERIMAVFFSVQYGTLLHH